MIDLDSYKTPICATSICACIFGLWYVLTGVIDPNNPNAIMRWCGQFGNAEESGFFKFVFLYGVLSCLIFFIAFWGILSVFALPKLAFGFKNKVYDVFLWILSFAGAFAVASWAKSLADTGSKFGDFLLVALFFVVGLLITTPLMLVAKCEDPLDEEFWIEFGLLILLLVISLFLIFTTMYFLNVLFFLGLLFFVGFLLSTGACFRIIIVF